MSFQDGNTGFQVAPAQVNPPTGDEMAKLKDFFNNFFERAATTFVQASELAKQVEELSRKVQALSGDIEYVRSRNVELDTMLSQTREQRDNAMRERDEARNELSNTQAELREAQHQINSDSRAIGDLQRMLSNARRERDDWAKLANEEGEAHKLWKGRAEEGRKRIADLASLFAEDKPKEEPKPEPTYQEQTSNHSTAEFAAPQSGEPQPDPEVKHDPEPWQAWNSRSA